jgi:hypothetical protein
VDVQFQCRAVLGAPRHQYFRFVGLTGTAACRSPDRDSGRSGIDPACQLRAPIAAIKSGEDKPESCRPKFRLIEENKPSIAIGRKIFFAMRLGR